MSLSLELRVVDTLVDVDPALWDECTNHHPFIQHRFLRALEVSQAVGQNAGIVPKYVLLHDEKGMLVAAAPAMLKWGTRREFGPEIHWLNTGRDAGCFDWPKFQVGVPFFPYSGPRLLVRPGLPEMEVKNALLKELYRMGGRMNNLSAFNLMHIDAAEARSSQRAGALISTEWQSNWFNPEMPSMDHYLASLTHQKRLEYLKVRKKAESHGLNFHVLDGEDITLDMIAQYYEGHRRVCERYGGRPWLPKIAYWEIVRNMADAAVLFGYFAGNRLVAGVLGLGKLQERVLHLLQWSEMRKLDGLALDLICLRPIELAIQRRLHQVSSGPAAQHKRLRGWTTVPVYNAHWFYSVKLKRIATSINEPPTGLMGGRMAS